MASSSDAARDLAIKGALSVEPIEQEPLYITEEELLNKHWVDLLVSHLKGEEVPIALWVQHVAKNPYQEVTVVNNRHDEVVLFTIPALFDRTREIYPENISSGLAEIVNKIASKNNIVPNSGNTILVESLVDTVAAPKSQALLAQKWAPMLNHYGIVLEGVEGVDGKTTKPKDGIILDYTEGDDDDDF